MLSIVEIGILLCSVPFGLITLHALGEYLKDKKNPQKEHILYAFASIFAGFVLFCLPATLLASPGMGLERLAIVNNLFRLFDAANMIGLFWFFVFLTDFMEHMKQHLPLVVIHLLITLVAILVPPADILILDGGAIAARGTFRLISILLFWLLYLSMLAYKFWRHSILMKKKVARRRSQTLSIGAAFAVFTYVLLTFGEINQSLTWVLIAQISSIAAGVVFYLGFITPGWLRRMWK